MSKYKIIKDYYKNNNQNKFEIKVINTGLNTLTGKRIKKLENIGKNLIKLLPKKIKSLCPKTNKVAVIIDRNVPKKFEKILSKNQHKSYEKGFREGADQKDNKPCVCGFWGSNKYVAEWHKDCQEGK